MLICGVRPAITGFRADKAVVAEDGTTGVIIAVRLLIGVRKDDSRRSRNKRFEGARMRLSELMDKLYELDVKDDDPDVVIDTRTLQVDVRDVEYIPQTDDEDSVVVIS